MVNIFLEASVGYTYLNTSANTLYSDKDIYGAVSYGMPKGVQKDFHSIYIGGSVGFDLHKVVKHK